MQPTSKWMSNKFFYTEKLIKIAINCIFIKISNYALCNLVCTIS